MTTPVQPIPEGYYSVTPYLIIKNAAEAIQFYAKAFGATEIFCMAGENGKIQHAEIQIGNSRIMLADECPEMDVYGPQTSERTPVMIHLYVENVDEIFNNAVAAGATVTRPLSNQFYGDRIGCLKDPYGHSWSVATHIEDVSHEALMAHAKN